MNSSQILLKIKAEDSSCCKSLHLKIFLEKLQIVCSLFNHVLWPSIEEKKMWLLTLQ